jgi:hypothetical protein
MDWIKKNKEVLATIGGLIAFFLLLFLLTIFFKDKGKEPSAGLPLKNEPAKVELKKVDKESSSNTTAPQTSSYFLQPVASDIIEKFSTMDPYQLKVESKKLPGLRIAWPVYFYSLEANQRGSSTLVLDSLENGFGVGISCDIDPALHPKLLELQQGDKFWIAGEVIGVDPEGVGQIFVNLEHVNFEENPRWSLSTQSAPTPKEPKASK